MQSIPTTVPGYETPMNAAKTVARERFAWPGGYALGIATDDGACICSACVADELEQIAGSTAGDGWHPACAYYTDADDGEDCNDILCDHCGRNICDATDNA